MTTQAALKISEKQDGATSSRRAQGAKVVKLVPKNKSDLTEAQREELVLEFRLKARKLGRSILRKWQARLDLQEVDSVVDLSLCEAVKRFDPNRGASFMTFLYYHLKGNLVRAVTSAANANIVPASDQQQDSENEDRNLANAIDIAESLSGSEPTLPEEELLQKELVELSQQACLKLDQLERQVIERIYLQGQQLLDIAATLGYSRCHISRVKKKALETLEVEMRARLDEQKPQKKVEPAASSSRRKIHRRRPRSKKAVELRKQRNAA